MTGNPPRCESNTCLQVVVTGASTELWESMQPDIRVVTTTASWQSWLDQAKAEERATIVTWLRGFADGYDAEFARSGEVTETASGYRRTADAIQRGLLAGLVAGDE